MKGGGYYSQNTEGAKHVINAAGVHVIEKLAQMDVSNQGRPFTIVDYGAADGGTSLDLITTIIRAVRQRTSEREINVVYTDLPHNDFSALFRMMHSHVPGIRSYLEEFSKVFVSGAGTSFYQQIVAGQTVNIGFSATAMHWLSALPGSISNHVHAVGAVGAEWQKFHDHARVDWEKILLNRARELVSGGVLVMANFCINERGEYLGNTVGVNMFDTFYSLWRQLADNGVITNAECQATVFPQFYRNIKQFRVAFDDPQSPVNGSGLRLETAYTGVTKCPYRAEFDQSGDPAAFADAYVPTLRSWSETVFFGALDTSRPIDERRAIVDRFYDNYNALVRREPERHAMDYVHTYMVVVKE